MGLGLNVYRRLLESNGFKTYYSSYTQSRLTGGTILVETVVGVSRDMGSRVQVTVGGSRAPRILVIHHAGGEDAATAIAERLESLGGDVEVDGERVVAVFEPANPPLLARIVSVIRGVQAR